MTQIIRGTTPTILFSFSDISVDDLSEAVLTIKQGNYSDSWNIGSAFIDSETNTIGWELTQADTLAMPGRTGFIVCDWVTVDGLRGRSRAEYFTTGDPGAEEVL